MNSSWNGSDRHCSGRLIVRSLSHAFDMGWYALRPLLLYIIVIFPQAGLVQAQDVERLAEVKAVYVYNILKFTYWPESTLAKDDVIEVCIIGKDWVSEALLQGFEGRYAQNRLIHVRSVDLDLRQRQLSLESAIHDCHLLYFCESASAQDVQLFRAMGLKGVLLVSGTAGFAESGGGVAVEFDERADRVHFVINNEAIAVSGLKISSKLLKFAEVIDSPSVKTE